MGASVSFGSLTSKSGTVLEKHPHLTGQVDKWATMREAWLYQHACADLPGRNKT